MQNNVVVYIPSDGKEGSEISMKRLLGVPFFLRCILTLEDSGHKNLMFLAPISARRQVLKSWNKYAGDSELTPHFIWTHSDHKLNQKIFSDVILHSAETVTFINANLLMTKSALKPWDGIRLKNGQHLVADIDRGLPPIASFRRHDMVRISGSVSAAPATIDEIIKDLIDSTGDHPACETWDEPVKLFTRFTRKRSAALFLTEQIRLNTPMWIARNINKRISLPISIILAKLRVRPNTITMANMLIGMCAGIGAAGRTYTGLLIGAIFFQLASIIDGCDGEVAKLTHRCTKFGQYIDTLSDNLALVGFFTGLMIHIYRVNNHTHLAWVLGGAILVGVFTLFGIMISFLKKNTNSASFVTYDTEFLQKLSDDYPKPVILLIKYGKYLLKKDFFSFLFLVLAILGILPAALFLALAGIWTGIAVLTYVNLRQSPKNATTGQAKFSGKKMVLFDFDGTLVDSMETFADIAAKIISRIYGTSFADARRQYIETSGLPFSEQIELLHPGDPRNKDSIHEFETGKKIGYFDQRVYPDAFELAATLKKRGILTAVSSNNFQELVDEYMSRSKLRLDYSLGFRSVDFCKGESHIEYLIKITGLHKKQLLFVGDSLKDAERAAGSNIDFVGKTGLFNKEEFKKQFPKYPVIDSLSEIKELIL